MKRRQSLGHLTIALIALVLVWMGSGGDRVMAGSGGQMWTAAQTAVTAGDWFGADRAWSALLQEFPEDPVLWRNRGNTRALLQQWSAAIADFNQAIALDPQAVDPYLNRGAIEENQGDYAAAIADYNQALDLDPQDALAYNNRGHAKGALGDWSGALADYDRAIAGDPRLIIARSNHVLALYQLGQTAAALREARQGVRKYPLFVELRAALTAILWATGHPGEAESHWVSVLGLDRRYANLTWVQQERHWPTAMVTALEQFLTLAPT